MLGFVNGRSCAHKSKPRGLINKNNSELQYLKFAAKLLLFFEIYIILLVMFRFRENLIRLRFDLKKIVSDFYPTRFKKYPISIRLS